jgi:tripartite-type tricarboxylate transporter receptor subunit TctC
MLGVSRQVRLRCSFPAIALVFTLACSLQLDAASVTFSKPIRFIVPYAPGGGTDVVARIYGGNLSRRVHQPVVIENRPGASGAVGVEVTAKAPPDGNTICIISASNTVNSATNPRLPYDLAKDLQGVSQLISQSFVLVVNPSLPVKSVRDLIAYAKANPGKLNFGSSGTGGVTHLAGVLLAHMSQTDMVHVAYRGEAAAIIDLMNGSTQFQIATLLNAKPHIDSGRLRALATSSNKRNPATPDLPTIAESGVPGYMVDQWYGVVTSAKVPQAIVNALSEEISLSAQDPEVVERLKKDGVEAVSSKPEELSAHIKSEIDKWGTLVRETGIKLQ